MDAEERADSDESDMDAEKGADSEESDMDAEESRDGEESGLDAEDDEEANPSSGSDDDSMLEEQGRASGSEEDFFTPLSTSSRERSAGAGSTTKRPRSPSPAAAAKRVRTDAGSGSGGVEDEITPLRPAPAVAAPAAGAVGAAMALDEPPPPPPLPSPPPPEFLLGICGPTGAGKSTVLNALLDGCNILPTSAMHACTAVPIEVRYRAPSNVAGVRVSPEEPDELDGLEQLLSGEAEEGADLDDGGDTDGRFGAEIEFVGEDEWATMLATAAGVVRRKADRKATLEATLTQAGAATNPSARALALEQYCDEEDTDDAGASHLAAVKAVLNGKLFASVAEFQAHCQTPAVQAVLRFLGQSLRFYGDRPPDISRRITRFLATTTGSTAGPSVWPLVRKAVVSGPWTLLSGGLTIVDLPGLGDANSARNAVVSGYIDRCHGILAAAPITRARDNKTTKDIFGGAREGIKAGRVKFLAFLATQADNVDPAEIVDELGGAFPRHYRKGLELHQSALLQAGPLPYMVPAAVQLQQVRDAEARVASLKTLSDNAGAVDEAILLAAQSEAAEKARMLRSYCVVARNGFVGAALAAQYKEDLADVLGPTALASIRELRVFPVSAVEYEKIMREGGGNADLSTSFTVARATGIPSLLDTLWSLSNTSPAVRARGEAETRAAYAARPGATPDAAEEVDVDSDALETFLNGILSEDQEPGASEEAGALAPDVLRKLMEQEAETAAARRQAAVQDSTKALQDRTKYLTRISALNKRAATALDRFLGHCSASATPVASKRRLDVWAKQAKELMSSTSASDDTSSALIAVLGDSGAGKSTLLNALLDVREGVLPVSGVRACTAAPIEISHYVGPPGARYMATVEFLSEEEWEAELSALLSDLADAGGVVRRNMERPRTEGGRLAYDKVVSLYGAVGSLKELRQMDASQGWLGTTATLKASSPQHIRQQLEDFVSSKSAGTLLGGSKSMAGRLWPIVKVARLRGPFALLANCGGRLLDLPGLQDSNEARNAVIQSYLTKCSAFLIAAPIRRAIDNRTARDLLGRQFRRQLLLDGRVGTVAFVATASDDLDALQVAAELGIKGVAKYADATEAQVHAKLSAHAPHIKRLRKRVAALGKRRAACEAATRRVTKAMEASAQARDVGAKTAHEHALAVTRNRARLRKLEQDLVVLRGAINKATTELRRREHIVNLLCATARNAFCRVQLRADFAEGIRDVMSASLVAAGSQTQEGGTQADADETYPELPVFTVSSRDYRCLSENTGQAVAFFTPAQTEVPRLREFVRHSMMVKSAANEVTRADRIELLLTSVIQYLTLAERATPAQQQSLMQVTKALTKTTGSQLGEVVLRTRTRLEQMLLLGPLAQALDLGDLKARRQAPRCLSTCEASMHWASFRACMKRSGEYTSPTAGQINLNESLAAPLMETAMQRWRHAFGTGVPKLLHLLKTDAQRVTEQTLESVVAAVTAQGLSAAPLSTDLGLAVRRSFELELTASMQAAELRVETFQRAAWATVSARVRASLAPAYELAKAEAGPGCVARLKAHMRAGVEQQRRAMFKAAVAQMHTGIEALTKQVQRELEAALGVHAREMLHSVEMVWDADCGLSVAKCTALVATLSSLSSFVRSVGAAAFALRAAMAGADFDAPDSHTSVLPVVAGLGGGSEPGGSLVSDAAVRAVLPPRSQPPWLAAAPAIAPAPATDGCDCDTCEGRRALSAAAGTGASVAAKREAPRGWY